MDLLDLKQNAELADKKIFADQRNYSLLIAGDHYNRSGDYQNVRFSISAE